MRRIYAVLTASSIVLALVAACGSDGDSLFSGGGGADGGDDGSGNLPGFSPGEGGVDLDAEASPIELTPADQTLTYVSGQPAPTLQFTARIIATGQVVPAAFTIDRGEIGAVGLSSGLFTASGTVGGKARVTATWNGTAASTSIRLKLKVVENGAAVIPDAGADGGGAGGNGGVGGDGPGGAVTPTTIAVLKGTPIAAPDLALLYPYDATVWPRGILAPLLMWRAGVSYDAVLIEIKEDNFTYEGTFASNAPNFKNHPIPQQAWKQMLSSNEGEEVTVSLKFAKDAVAYGPLSVKWKVASAPLKGTVYYNSYGTKLAKNYPGAKPDNARFGGATLAIRGGSTDPTLVAGGDGDATYCRVCHSVAANGSKLITQRDTGDKRLFSTYDLTSGAETPMTPEGGGRSNTNKYSWPAIYPDGTMFLGDSSAADGSHDTPNQLYQTVSGTTAVAADPLPMNGWPAGFRAAFPAFSPDGKSLAFTMFAGAAGADQKTLGIMTFDKATHTFGPLTELHRPAAPNTALYPAFLPTNKGIVFHVETRYNTRDYGGTRSDADTSDPPKADQGTRAELWWVNVPAAGSPAQATRLDKLNGVGYLPTGPDAHDKDAELNYEPTVNPVPSGGYAWVVFTSRRLYGNVATMNPFHSDPRYFDLTQEATTKKLWVAAIDLNAAPGTDPSHPAFYLPAQELLAGNSRGYWVVDPCKADGNACETGDECCGGFCRPNQSGALVCSNVVPTCAQEFEKCASSADCCNSPSFQCINGRCATPAPK
ncbi:MAG: PD40 domain-containing protein [Labilithrix sp.]|nr:PD40 domain-containing protein [Labilithrix sp.]